jgi:ABC-2 type transport system ATP-binding protein
LESSSHSVRVNKVSHHYEKGAKALDAVSFAVEKGETIGLIGANGSGKTTLLKLLAGHLKPGTGTVGVLGFQPHLLSKEFRTSVGYISQDAAVDPEMTGKELLHLFATLNGLKSSVAKNRIAELASLFELQEHLSKRVENYSGGLRQRLHLALGVIHHPDFLLLDEPTSALDPKGRKQIWNWISKYARQKMGAIIITHDLEEAAEYCSKVAILDKGKLLNFDSPQTIIKNHNAVKFTLILEKAPKATEELEEKLMNLQEVIRFKMEGKKVLLSAKNQEQAEEKIIGLFQNHGYQIASVEKHFPNLATAYFDITGNTSLKPDFSRKGQKGNRKQKKVRGF